MFPSVLDLGPISMSALSLLRACSTNQRSRYVSNGFADSLSKDWASSEQDQIGHRKLALVTQRRVDSKACRLKGLCIHWLLVLHVTAHLRVYSLAVNVTCVDPTACLCNGMSTQRRVDSSVCRCNGHWIFLSMQRRVYSMACRLNGVSTHWGVDSTACRCIACRPNGVSMHRVSIQRRVDPMVCRHKDL